MSDLYTGPAIAQAVGVTYRQIDYWRNCGALVPEKIDGVASSGSGNRRVYKETELEVARVMARFTELGVPEIGRLARELVEGRTVELPGGIEIRMKDVDRTS